MKKKKKKIIAIFIAYKAATTVEKFYKNFPLKWVDEVILVDDCSPDRTFEIAKKLGIQAYQNSINLGYGGNLKRTLAIALERGADVIIDIHPDGEYKPSAIPAAIAEIDKGFQFVLGNRFTSTTNPLKKGMYFWKVIPLRILTWIDRVILNIPINDFHQGFRVYTRGMLEKVNFEANSNNYIFSFELIAQSAFNNIKISQVPVETSYTGKKRGASLKNSLIYSLDTFKILFWFILAKLNYKKSIFQKPQGSLSSRIVRLQDPRYIKLGIEGTLPV